ncbi:MAG TPA: DegT/DnrJ/EryC1/StrS family aminotransferase [Ignavibacteriaceae bacterium]|nr:DegT/DnrJ/EryC1/StrS family aminotransferase [Ignavibacteriaceae bacterium]
MIEYENLRDSNELFFEDYIHNFGNVLNSGWFILGSFEKKFEEDFAKYIGSNYCVGLASGLDALYLALKAFNFEKNSEIVVPSNTYIATILSIVNAGLKPVLVEPDIQTYNIDPAKIEESITSKTKALMIVHLYGKSCDMDPIISICKKHNLKLIEDCAQSHGAKYKNRNTGTFGEINAFSFYPTKNLGALGDAGAITTDSENYYTLIKKLRNYGSEEKYHNDIAGINSRLDEIQAGFLNIKLKKLNVINLHKRELANLYHQNLKEDFIKPVVNEDHFDVYHIYNIRHPKRDELKEYLLKNEIKTEIHYPVPPHKQKAMKGIIEESSFPISEEIHSTTLSLPISFGHSRDQIMKVIDVLNKF